MMSLWVSVLVSQTIICCHGFQVAPRARLDLGPSLRQPTSPTQTTELNMGIRSFISSKIRRGRKDDNENNNNNNSEQDDDDDFELPDPPTDDVKKPAIFQRARASSPPPMDSRESIHERMQRFKQGGMTSEEKEAFLDRALSWKAASKKNKKTIRQSLPLGGVPVKLYDEQDDEAFSKNAPKKSSSNPGATAETSWSHVVSTKRHEQRERYGISKAGGGVPLMDDAAKEAWLNMVTSPTRFQGYSAVQKNAENPTPNQVPQTTQPVTQQQLRDLSDAKRRLIEQQKIFEEMSQGGKSPGEKLLESSPFLPRGAGSKLSDDEATEELESPVLQEASTIQIPETNTREEAKENPDLASRLQEAAMLQEKRDREAREAMETENRRIQQEEQRRLAERQRERQRVTEQQEVMRIQKRKQEEEKLLQAQRLKLEDDVKKRKELEEKQMEYWNKKLEQERASKTPPTDSKAAVDGEAIRLAKEKEANQIRMREVQREDERGLLKKAAEAREESRHRAEAITEATAQQIKRNSGVDTFIQAQAARKDAMKKFTQDQQSHLSDLNSLKSRGSQLPLQPTSSQLPLQPATRGSQLPASTSLPTSRASAAPTGISVGDILSGRVNVDDEALDQYKDLDQEGRDMSEEDAQKGIEETLKTYSKPPPQRPNKPIRQTLPDPGPVRQKLPAFESTPAQPTTARPASLDISDEDKKKANKWGINLDKLL